jgi:hypothetical protein
MNTQDRVIIARALHVAANSFGHVIGEHDELVETLTDAGFADTARRVDAIMDRIGGETHKEIRTNWRRELQVVSDGL